MRGGSSLKAVLISTALASAAHVGCGPAVEGVDTEVEGLGSEVDLEDEAVEEPPVDAPALEETLPGPGELAPETALELQALDSEELLQPMGDHRGRRRVLVCRFREDDWRDGRVRRVSRREARRLLFRGRACLVRDRTLDPGDPCDWRDCRRFRDWDGDWDDHDREDRD